MAKTNLGRVVGLSAFEEWKIKNPEGTWEQFMESLKGPGVQGFEFKEELENGDRVYDVILEGNIKSGTITIGPGKPGKSIYEIWLEQGNTGTEEEFINSLVPNFTSKFIGKGPKGENIYGWFDKFENKVGEYVAEKGDRGETGRPGINADGTIPEYPDPPLTAPYGTLLEFAGSTPPSGWVFANGEQLPKGKFPFLVGILPHISVPKPSDIVIDRTVDFASKTINGEEGWVCLENTENETTLYKPLKELKIADWLVKDCKQNLSKDHFLFGDDGSSFNSNYDGTLLINYNHNNQNECVNIPLIINFKRKLFIQRITFSNYKMAKDIIIDIQVKAGDIWTTVETIRTNKNTTPMPENSSRLMYIPTTNLYLNEFRLVLNWASYADRSLGSTSVGSIKGQYLGYLALHLGETSLELTEIIQLPLEKDSKDRYKIIYVGEPILQQTEQSMYTYNSNLELTGELSLKKCVKNHIPSYIEGITMTTPFKARLGYSNKYNKINDTWELEKTHLNKEGYYYDENEDLRYTPKPSICHIFDFNAHTWVFSQEKKENALKSILEDIALKKMQKETMIELNLNLSKIDIEIENLKKEIEEVKKINE